MFFLAFKSYAAPSASRLYSSTSCCRSKYNVLFFGSDRFSQHVLQGIHQNSSGLIGNLQVVVPPGKPQGRKSKIEPRPLAETATDLGLQVITVDPQVLAAWKLETSFDIMLTASFPYMIPSSLIDYFPPKNALNLHPSLLPKYRGAAPLQWAILNRDSQSGVCLQTLSKEKFDHGLILGKKTIDIEQPEYLQLEKQLAQKGAELFIETLKDFEIKKSGAVEQDEKLASYAIKITKDHSKVNWKTMSSSQIHAIERALGHKQPPWSSFKLDGPTNGTENTTIQFQFSPATAPFKDFDNPSPGKFGFEKKRVFIGCVSDYIGIEKVKMPNCKWVEAKEWWNGQGKKWRNSNAV